MAVTALAATACEGNSAFDLNPLLAADTVQIAAPIAGNDTLPSALDLTAQVGLIRGGRFPERIPDATAWDFLIRVDNGSLQLVPAGAFGVVGGARISRPLSGTFEGLREAPPISTMVADSAVTLSVGAVFAARSRERSGCTQFSKLQPLELDVERGRVTLQIVTNERCGDPRLSER